LRRFSLADCHASGLMGKVMVIVWPPTATIQELNDLI